MKKDLFWILLIVVIRLATFFYINNEFHTAVTTHGFVVFEPVAVKTNDFFGYYPPLDNWLNGNGYSFELETNDGVEYTPTAKRMPGLGVLYVPLRLMFSFNQSINVIIIIQLILDILSCYLIAKLSENLFKKRWLFKLTAFFGAFSIFIAVHNQLTGTDSLGLSSLIFSIWFFNQYLKKMTTPYLLISGVFLAWSVFLRPINIVIVPILIFALLHYSNAKWLSIENIKKLSLLMLPLITCMSLWTLRNYNQFNKIIPGQMPMKELNWENKHRLQLFDFIIAQGEDLVPWYKGSLGEWFMYSATSNFQLESLTYTNAFNQDSLKKLRINYSKMIDPTIAIEKRKKIGMYVEKCTETYISSIKKERPFIYYFKNRINLIRLLLVHEHYEGLPFPKREEMTVYHFLLKAGAIVYLNTVLIFGLLGLFMAVINKKVVYKYLAFVPLGFVFVLATVLGYVEQRYVLPIYAFLLPFYSFLIYKVGVFGYDFIYERLRR